MQKIIVSDTSCIGYLIQINLLHLLQILYGEIIIPVAVNDEILRLANKGHILSEFKKADWIKIYSDEKLGRIIATTIGFDITGLVGILITAKNKNLIPSVKTALDKVILLECRISKKLYNIALKSCNEQ